MTSKVVLVPGDRSAKPAPPNPFVASGSVPLGFANARLTPVISSAYCVSPGNPSAVQRKVTGVGAASGSWIPFAGARRTTRSPGGESPSRSTTNTSVPPSGSSSVSSGASLLKPTREPSRLTSGLETVPEPLVSRSIRSRTRSLIRMAEARGIWRMGPGARWAAAAPVRLVAAVAKTTTRPSPLNAGSPLGPSPGWPPVVTVRHRSVPVERFRRMIWLTPVVQGAAGLPALDSKARRSPSPERTGARLGPFPTGRRGLIRRRCGSTAWTRPP
jgi:hypothetical protein